MEELELWLKRMENGTIGEARTRELLIDRFWILDRSVDIDGADLIIQQRITRNLIDTKPHRLGIIQAKYREKLTGIEIKQDYVQNEKGEPREGFFLFIHSGKEKNKKCWFFSSLDLDDIREDIFDESNNIYVLSDAVNWDKFLVNDVTKVLDLIEEGLKSAEITLNNEFIEKHITHTEKDFSNIYHMNWYRDNDENSIVDLVLPYKKDVREATKLIWKDLSTLIKLHNEVDPLKFHDGLISNYSNDLQGHRYLLPNIQDAIEKLKDSSIKIQDNDFHIEYEINQYNEINLWC
ncbi:hypothetical protein [Bacillus toyonensis]|uniref:Uncharacterized protein n=1 Tax=Bacillus toyonensis TaxID=155322 RepID=A0A2A8HDN4_9BACI|nr:hypothetical protein [Bacillus toyonensis]PEQ04963.1 hypothetical protein CN585_16630 [Bacillus toyonensis]